MKNNPFFMFDMDVKIGLMYYYWPYLIIGLI